MEKEFQEVIIRTTMCVFLVRLRTEHTSKATNANSELYPVTVNYEENKVFPSM